MQKAMRVNNSQTENPCWRRCASKRDETCHIGCNAYTEWVLMLAKRRERNMV